jgi:hypothetical protein
MASIATGLDYQTQGSQTSTGSAMRARQDDQSGGTDSGDADQAWRSYGQELRIRDGATWADALEDLEDGRLVHLDVYAADAGGPCLSGSGAYGHTIAVAPERSGARWLTADPWCSPARWIWWDEALLRSGAETWGGMTYSAATSGPFPFPRARSSEIELVARMRLAARRLMTSYRPDRPALIRPRDTGGSEGRILFTTTSAPAPELEDLDMPINAAAGLVSTIRARIYAGVDWYEDPNLTRRGGSFSSNADVVYVGAPVGETVAGGSYAVQVNTGAIYSDHVVRPTVVYVAVADADTYSVPPPEPTDVAEIQAERDATWRDALMGGDPWPSL